jgi:prepilin peptidase CpaA
LTHWQRGHFPKLDGDSPTSAARGAGAMQSVFFPNLTFAWIFVACLFSILIAAAYSDLNRMVIPKSISLTGLALGICFNVARGAWLGSNTLATWVFTDATMSVGALDGLLFALAGFVFGFVLFFLLWMLGVAGGGDVKLLAALGAWIGPKLTLYVLVATLVLIAGIILFHAFTAVFRGKLIEKQSKRNGTIKKRLVTFALPLTIATGLVFYFALGKELRLV